MGNRKSEYGHGESKSESIAPEADSLSTRPSGRYAGTNRPITKFLEETVCSDVSIITDYLDTSNPASSFQAFTKQKTLRSPLNFFQSLGDVTVLKF